MGFLDFVGGLFSSAPNVADSFGDIGGAAGLASAAPAVSESLGDIAGAIGDAGASQFANVAGAAPASGFWDVASSIGSGLKSGASELGSIAKSITPALALGAQGLNVANTMKANEQAGRMTKLAERSAGRQDQLSREQQNVAAPLQQFSSDQLARASRGELPPDVEARIQETIRNMRQQWNDRLARGGQGDSTGLQQIEDWIAEREQMMRGAALRDLQMTGVGAAGQAGNILAGASGSSAGAGQIAQQQQGGLEKLIALAEQEMARMGASK